MTLDVDDIVFYYTDTGSSTDPMASLGGTINDSGDTITSDQANNVFDDVTGAESSVGVTHYVGIAIKDTVTGEDYHNIYVWISGTVHATGTSDTLSFGIEDEDGGSIQAIADDETAPGTAGFTTPAGGPWDWQTEGAPSSSLQYGTLSGDDWFGIWFRRVVPASADAFSSRKVTLTVRGETTGSPMMILQKEFTFEWGKDALPICTQAKGSIFRG